MMLLQVQLCTVDDLESKLICFGCRLLSQQPLGAIDQVDIEQPIISNPVNFEDICELQDKVLWNWRAV